jgi:hypothetical protein
MNLMTEDEKWQKRSLSRDQIGTLRYIQKHEVRIDHLEEAHGGTIYSLLYRKYVARQGDSVVLTAAGEGALREYERSGWKERLHAGPLTERVERMLRYAPCGAVGGRRELMVKSIDYFDHMRGWSTGPNPLWDENGFPLGPPGSGHRRRSDFEEWVRCRRPPRMAFD